MPESHAWTQLGHTSMLCRWWWWWWWWIWSHWHRSLMQALKVQQAHVNGKAKEHVLCTLCKCMSFDGLIQRVKTNYCQLWLNSHSRADICYSYPYTMVLAGINFKFKLNKFVSHQTLNKSASYCFVTNSTLPLFEHPCYKICKFHKHQESEKNDKHLRYDP